jgi:thymidylate kinase
VVGNFVTFHGIDGTGKSTSVVHTFESLSSAGFSVMDWPEAEVLGASDPPPASKQAYSGSLAKKIAQGNAVRVALEAGSTVIKDRWVIDVLAAHAFQGVQLNINPEDFLAPDMAVVLICDEHVRMADRILKRTNPTPEDLIPKAPGTRASFFEEYLLKNITALSKDHLVIDTTSMKPETVAETVMGRLNGCYASL